MQSDRKYCAALIASHPREIRENWLAGLTTRQLELLVDDWQFWARDDQLPPQGTWSKWMILGGRGAGKTRAGSGWIASQVAQGLLGRIALVGETLNDAREVMIAGESGLMAAHGTFARPKYEASRRRVVWENGAVAHLFSAEDPESLRGPQFDGAWCDEVGKWRRDVDTWDMLAFGLRLGSEPKVCITTTPRNTLLINRLLKDKGVHVSRAPTSSNVANLAPGFIDALNDRYGGTRLARQELDGELLIDDPEALWQRNWIETNRVSLPPELIRVVIGLDPSVTGRSASNSCGIVVAGLDANQHIYVLADRTVQGCNPSQWAKVVKSATHDFSADAVVAEVNQGGELVSTVLNQAEVEVPIHAVHARLSKAARAAPISLLYERGKVSHVGLLAALEDQMCTWNIGSRDSPDRIDALVWALTFLSSSLRSGPRIQAI